MHDAQFMTAHLARFGAVEISRAEYARRLAAALAAPADFARMSRYALGAEAMQAISQAS